MLFLGILRALIKIILISGQKTLPTERLQLPNEKFLQSTTSAMFWKTTTTIPTKNGRHSKRGNASVS
jgi:hypothetical protein